MAALLQGAQLPKKNKPQDSAIEMGNDDGGAVLMPVHCNDLILGL